jgi:hypothetical protein
VVSPSGMPPPPVPAVDTEELFEITQLFEQVFS